MNSYCLHYIDIQGLHLCHTNNHLYTIIKVSVVYRLQEWHFYTMDALHGTSNVTSVTEVQSASAHLFAGMWCPW